MSITVQWNDIDRAKTRAELLARGTGNNVTPIAIGVKEEPATRNENVRVILIPERDSR